MRNLSSNAVASLMAQETGEVWLYLIKVDHATLDEPFYLVNNNETITSNGIDYVPYAFELTLPDDDPDKLPVVNITIDNVDRLLVETIRAIDTSPLFTISLIMASQPDIVEIQTIDMEIRNTVYNATTITGDLVVEDILNQKFPAGRIDYKQYGSL